MFCTGCAKEIQLRCVAVVHDVAILADDIDLGCVNLERGKLPANDSKYSTDNLPEATESGDDNRMLLILHLVVLGLFVFLQPRNEILVEHIDNRRQQH